MVGKEYNTVKNPENITSENTKSESIMIAIGIAAFAAAIVVAFFLE